MASPPTGTVTFLFTDIEGSTGMWERSPQAMQAVLARHDELLRRAIEEHGGHVFKTVGDAFCAAFPTASNALEAATWLERLEAEHDNMREALSWSLGQENMELGLRLAGALWRFWWMRSHYSEGRRWLENALAKDGRGSPAPRAMALAGIGEIASHQGDLDQAQEACEEGLELLAHEASQAKIYLLLSLAKVARMREDHNWATQLNEESVALSREMRDTWGLASSLLSSALVTYIRGDSERATELYEESMDLFREWATSKVSPSACTIWD